MIAVLLGALLLVIPSVSGSSEAGVFSLVVELDEPPQEEWFVAGDSLIVNLAILNSGAADSLTSNPSCPAILKAYNGTQLIYDGTLSTTCRQQSRGTDFNAGEQIEWANLQWDFKNNDMNWVDSGMISIVISVPETDLLTSFTTFWQSPKLFSEDLKIQLTPGQTPNDEYNLQNPLFVSVALNNFGEDVQLIDSGCNIQFKAFQDGITIYDELTSLSCANGAVSISKYDSLALGWLDWRFEEATEGEIVIEIGFAGQQLSSNFTIYYTQINQSAFPQLSSIDSQVTTTLQLSQTENELGIIETGKGDSLGFTSTIMNTGAENVSFSFESTCRMEVFVINQIGEIVYDSRDMRECRTLHVDHILEENQILSFEHANWGLTDKQGCGLTSGDYIAIVESDELMIFDSVEFRYIDDGDGSKCKSDYEGIDSISLDVVVLEIDMGFTLDMTLSGINDDSLLQYSGPCKLIISVNEKGLPATSGERFELCGNDLSGQQYIIPLDGVFILGSLELQMKGQDGVPLQSGEYEIHLSTNSWPRAELLLNVTWLDEAVENFSPVETIDDVGVSNTDSGTIVNGKWIYITNHNGGCWILETNSQQFLLTNATSIANWAPKPRLTGTYLISANNDLSLECSVWENTITLVEVYDENQVPLESEEDSAAINFVDDEEGVIQTYAPSVITAVASTSILSLLVITIISNESWRIPATQFSLGLIGLIGRTHETTDGKYQRGRLMGYLTANPGCHFRALMAALSMSNGQITHHLKILEEEDNLWRKKDGRLVRYYPATISFDTPEEQLPVPSLSPDPNSLQGKILRLLDHDGEMGMYPTQSELADRLEKSQQLISHHLRTLQKYGLVEKTRGGLKHRYHLTKEAVFLLTNPRT